jgi:hypothetical protein
MADIPNKLKDIGTRIKLGNEKADIVAEYMNFRLDSGLVPASREEDIRDKLDYYSPSVDKTFQVKVRDNREDIIHETHKFKKPKEFHGKKVNKNTKFIFDSGRDANCKADYYVCKSCLKSGEPDRIYVTKTVDVKNICDKTFAEWKQKEPELEFNDKFVYETWKRADLHRTRKAFCFRSELGVEIYFKIDEGRDTEPYAKLLCFVPPESIKQNGGYLRTVQAREGEEILDRSSWKIA